MKYLIVNADDFGLSAGVNRGVVEAHRGGILTSASLMVETGGSEEAARLMKELPWLSVGLHADLPDSLPEASRARVELERQMRRFHRLTGRAPTHLDSHRNRHRKPELLPEFIEVAHAHNVPLREHSAALYFS